MEKGISLNKEEVDGQDDVTMVLKDEGWQCNKFKIWNMGRSASSCLPFKESKVWAVDVCCSPCIIGSNRAITNKIGGKKMLKG